MPVAQLPKRELIIRGSTIVTPEQAALDHGLVGKWRIERHAGLMLPDSSGFANHGTLAGGSSWVIDRLGPMVYFDGVDGRVDTRTTPFSGATELSFELLVKHIASNDGCWIGTNLAYSAAIYIATRATNGVQFWINGVKAEQGTGATAGTIYHVVCTYIANTSLIIYVDGVEFVSNVVGIPASVNAHSYLVFGDTIAGANLPSESQLANVRAYNRALTPPEVSARYQIARRRMQSFGGERRIIAGIVAAAVARRIFITHA